jgi:hypothetical protein
MEDHTDTHSLYLQVRWQERWQSWFKRHAWLPWILAALRPASIFMYSTTPLQMKGPSRYLLEGERIFPVICPCMELQVPPPVRQ